VRIITGHGSAVSGKNPVSSVSSRDLRLESTVWNGLLENPRFIGSVGANLVFALASEPVLNNPAGGNTVLDAFSSSCAGRCSQAISREGDC
jgi:hypothetical protein